MEDKVKVFSSGIGFDGLLIILGIIFCILKGAGVLTEGFLWLYCCIPFMIIAAEFGLGLIIFLICIVVVLFTSRKQLHKED